MVDYHYDPVLLQELKRYDTKFGRFYENPNGDWYPSATTILSASDTKSELNKWIDAVGIDVAEKIRDLAGARGEILHKLLELHYRGDPLPKKIMPIHYNMYKDVLKEMDGHVGRIYGIEARLWSETLGVAGSCDLVCDWDGIPTIVDYKNGRTFKYDDMVYGYFIQSTMYSLMFEERTGIQTPNIIIIVANDDTYRPQVFYRKRKDYLQEVKEAIIRWRQKNAETWSILRNPNIDNILHFCS